jgi:DnaJ-domain-containing protein 1
MPPYCLKGMLLNVPFTLAFPLILRTLQEMGIQKVEPEKNSRRAIIFAKMPADLSSGGEELLILVEGLVSARTSVRIASKSTVSDQKAESLKNQENVERFMGLLSNLATEIQTSMIEKENLPPTRRIDLKTDCFPAQSRQSPHQILGITPGASLEEVTTAYRRKVKKYHPDRLAGLPPEFRRIAEDWMKSINAAYEELTRKSS